MSFSQALVPTEHASRYLQQLCKHWSHKFDVEFTAQNGRIAFDEDQIVTLTADESALHLTVTAPQANLPRMEQVVADHITRFAFREELVFNWLRSEQ